MKKNQCSSYQKLSKSTFLAMLGPIPFKKDKFFDEVGMPTTSKKLYNKFLNNEYPDNPYRDDEVFSNVKTRKFFEKIKYPWEITSFDPESRQVCVEINDPKGIKHISITLPNPI